MLTQRKLFFPIFEILPLSGLYEDSRHTASRVQDLVNLHLCLAIYSVLFFGVNHHHIIHHWKFIVPFALGTKTDLIAMMLNLRFMPQGCLYLKEGEGKKKNQLLFAALSKISHLPPARFSLSLCSPSLLQISEGLRLSHMICKHTFCLRYFAVSPLYPQVDVLLYTIQLPAQQVQLEERWQFVNKRQEEHKKKPARSDTALKQ